jgi:hemin uptake protein HemP
MGMNDLSSNLMPAPISSTAPQRREAELETDVHGLSVPPARNSAELLDVHGQLTILHNGDRYLLRRTKQGKLILTK